jgi:hypothetical protein
MMFAIPVQAALRTGTYASNGIVESTNGNPNCGAVMLTPGAPSTAIYKIPPPDKAGFRIYVSFPGVEQTCYKFARFPVSGLNGYASDATCNVVSTTGGFVPAPGNRFQFTATEVDGESAVATVTVTLSPSSIGSGCVATLNTTLIRTGGY